jgi:hypothetical protein
MIKITFLSEKRVRSPLHNNDFKMININYNSIYNLTLEMNKMSHGRKKAYPGLSISLQHSINQLLACEINFY